MLKTFITKIKDASFSEVPFRHIALEEFIDPKYFDEITRSDEINLSQAVDTRYLVQNLWGLGWNEILFPGTTTSLEDYILWEKGLKGDSNVDTCEGFGMVFRLKSPGSSILSEVQNILASDEFVSALCDKFELQFEQVYPDTGIQKYLNGYEISPHPDVRSKALTFMVNINPMHNSESLDYHTKYLRFIDKYRYVQEFWKHNPEYDRCWVPWSWCERVFEQKKNNSIVIFAPSDSSIHGVKASYDHLNTQRTQLYGNLWYRDMASTVYIDDNNCVDRLIQLPWQSYVIDEAKGTSMFYKGESSLEKKSLLKRIYSKGRGLFNSL